MAKSSCFVILWVCPFLVLADDKWKEGVGCTAIALDGAGSVDGSGFAGMNADTGAGDWRLSFVPATDHDEGAQRPVYPQRLLYPRFIGHGRGAIYHPDKYPGFNVSVALAHIPEVKHTYGYYESLQPLMNDQGLGLGESSCGAMLMNKAPGDTTDKRDVPTGLLDTAALMQLALERCATSRCAAETMGKLSEEHGFGPTPGEVAGLASCQGRVCWDDSGEAYSIVDKSGEAWIFHVIGGVSGIINAVWVAQRVPKGHLAVVANEFTIGELPDEPNDDYLFNPKIRDAAIAAKLWDGKGTLNWKRVFAPESVTFESPTGATPIPLYASLRQWGLYNLVAPSLKLSLKMSSQELPFSVPVDRQMSHRDVQDLLRYYYQGTEFDLTQGVLAGPFGNPFRIEGGPSSGQIPRGISIQRTLYGIVAQSGPQKQVGWYAMDTPSTSVFVPFFPQVNAVSSAYQAGHQDQFDRDSAGWAFNFVSNLMTWNYKASSEQEVYPAIQKWQDAIDEQMDRLDTSSAEKLADWQVSIQEQVVASWWKMADFIVMKYNDGKVNYPVVGTSAGYPQAFADMIGFGNDVHPIWVQAASTPPSSISWTQLNPLPTIWSAAAQKWFFADEISKNLAAAPSNPSPQLQMMVMTLALGIAIGVVIGRQSKTTHKASDVYMPLA